MHIFIIMYPFRVDVTGFVFHKKHPGILYARTDIGGTYRFDSENQRWVSLIEHVTEQDLSQYLPWLNYVFGGIPTMVAIRQRDLCGGLSYHVCADGGEGGVTVFLCEESHYDIGIRKFWGDFECFLRLRLGDSDHIEKTYCYPMHSTNFDPF